MSDAPTHDARPDSTRGGQSQISLPWNSTTRSGETMSSEDDLVSLLRSDPELARNRSFVIERAVDEFARLAMKSGALAPRDFCRRYAELGSSLQSSICRQLEVDKFVNRHSWLKNLIGECEWPASGERLASFQIIEEIGRGASSRVYLCSQPDLGGRQVAVKIGRDVVLEAHTLGLLRHANIVPIYAAERHLPSGRMLICMPFLGRSTLLDLNDLTREEGCPTSCQVLLRAAQVWNQPSDRFLELIVKRGYLPSSSYYDGIAYIGSCMAAALAHAHSQGIVHGDIKPSNILLSNNGEPCLMDFNLSGNSSLAISARGGTLPYMPPEQLRTVALENPHVARYDHRSDIFSLGVVLYELLSGCSPFPIECTNSEASKVAEGLLDLQREGCPPLRRQNVNVPKSLARTIEQCLAFRPEDRIQSASELHKRLLAELRLSRRIRRLATHHPRAAACATASLAVCLFALTGRILSAPPEHVSLFHEALRLQAAGDPQHAEALLARTIAIEPSYRDARFEYAKAVLARGDTGLARDTFRQMAKLEKDGLSAAYLGYCFSLEGKFSAAIPWYLRALSLGQNTADVRNNLAVAYEMGGSPLDAATQLDRTERYLKQALRQLPNSPTIRLNLLIHFVHKARDQGVQVSPEVIQFCETMTSDFPTCGEVFGCAARVACYSQDSDNLDQGLLWLQRAQDLGYGPSSSELRSDKAWMPLRRLPTFATAVADADRPQGEGRSGAKIPRLLAPAP